MAFIQRRLTARTINSSTIIIKTSRSLSCGQFSSPKSHSSSLYKPTWFRPFSHESNQSIKSTSPTSPNPPNSLHDPSQSTIPLVFLRFDDDRFTISVLNQQNSALKMLISRTRRDLGLNQLSSRVSAGSNNSTASSASSVDTRLVAVCDDLIYECQAALRQSATDVSLLPPGCVYLDVGINGRSSDQVSPVIATKLAEALRQPLLQPVGDDVPPSVSENSDVSGPAALSSSSSTASASQHKTSSEIKFDMPAALKLVRQSAQLGRMATAKDSKGEASTQEQIRMAVAMLSFGFVIGWMLPFEL